MEALDKRVQFLMTMPEEYEAITGPQLTMAPSQDMQYVRVTIEEYEMGKGKTGAAASLGRQSIPSAAFLACQDGESSARCFNCGRRGHWKSACTTHPLSPDTDYRQPV